ncbi:hypothetical protein ACXGQW_09065 [Wenyingzhuangia sp. IMCC45533]
MIQKSILILIISVFFNSVNTLQAQNKPKELDRFITKKRNHNKNSKTGFSVVLYNGNEEKALQTYNQFKQAFDNIEMKLTYVSPDWKVVTSPYKSKLEAEKIYLLIKSKYPTAKIL